MSTDHCATMQKNIEQYQSKGYVILEDAIPPEKLSEVQESYEETVADAIRLGFAEKDETTGLMKGHRFQNPHHPQLAKRPLTEAISSPPIIEFISEFVGGEFAFFGFAAFAMNEDFDYRGGWHRDSYAAWGKDSPEEMRVRELKHYKCIQVLLALRDDECFWFVPGSHNRPNTPDEEAHFNENRTGWEEMFEGAIQVKLRAGSAVPFDSRGIHRGLKRPGVSRRSVFIVYGPPEDLKNSAIKGWAQDPVYSDEEYLASLPAPLRESIERSIRIVERDS